MAARLYKQMGKLLWSSSINGGSLIIQTEIIILQKGIAYGRKLGNGN